MKNEIETLLENETPLAAQASPIQISANRLFNSPIYIGDKRFNKSLQNKNYKSIATPYTVGMMKKIVKPYCQRVKLLKQNSTDEQFNLQKEGLVLELHKDTLISLLKTVDSTGKKCDGLIAVLAVDKDDDSENIKNQTFILIPVDSNGKALKLNTPTAHYGEQRWPAINKPMAQVIGNSGNDPDVTIETKIDHYFHVTLGIPQ